MEDQAMQSKNKLKSKSREELQKNEIYRARDMKWNRWEGDMRFWYSDFLNKSIFNYL